MIRGGPRAPGSAFVAVLAIAVLLVACGGGGAPASTDGSQPTTSAAASGSASAEASASASSTESVRPTAPTGWTAVAEFVEDGASYLGADVVAWDGRFVAAGTHYAGSVWAVFGPPPPPSGRLWTSTDGESWEDATPPDTFEGVELVDLLITADGALIAIATLTEGEAAGPPSRSVVWETADGAGWTEIALTGLPEGATVLEAASGAQGHLLVAADDDGRTAYHSPDGREWTAALDDASRVAAGEEGFVAVLEPPDGSGRRLTASADGRAWVDGPALGSATVAVTGVGPDWLRADTVLDDHVVGEDPPPPATVHHSADGLSWEPRGEVAMGTFASCFEVVADLVTVGGHVILSTSLAPCGEGRVTLPGAAYASADGSAWESLPFGDHAAVRGGAAVDDRVVVIVDRGTNAGPVDHQLAAAIWLGPSQP